MMKEDVQCWANTNSSMDNWPSEQALAQMHSGEEGRNEGIKDTRGKNVKKWIRQFEEAKMFRMCTFPLKNSNSNHIFMVYIWTYLISNHNHMATGRKQP
jgi:hypothetical protein